ncbi:MAG TPA: hypothetical protein VGH19_13200 [Verrucomicrobiae bacterium]
MQAQQIMPSWRQLLLLVVACLAAVPAFAAEPPQEPHVLTLSNGDVLRGRMVSYEQAAGLGWSRADSLGTMVFDAAKVQAIDLGPAKSIPPSGELPARVRLRNGDVVDGSVMALETNALKFETVFDGQLTIPRPLLRSLSPQSANLKTVFDGIKDMNGWTFAEVTSAGDDAGFWTFQPGAFLATKSASVARDLKLPGQMTMEFDVAWRGTLNLAIAVFTDSLKPISLRATENEPAFAAFYSLQINSHSVNLLYVSQKEPVRTVGQVIAPVLSQKNEARVTIHASKDRKTITLLIDGVLVKQWTEGMSPAQGTGVRFVHQGQGSVRLSNLRVSEWDGRLDEVSPSNHVGPDEALITVSGERMVGKLLAYNQTNVTLQTGQTSFNVALERVQRIEFSPVKNISEGAVTAGKGRLARAKLGSGGVLTFELLSWKDGKARVLLPGIGEAEIKTELIQEMVFLDAAGAVKQGGGE